MTIFKYILFNITNPMLLSSFKNQDKECQKQALRKHASILVHLWVFTLHVNNIGEYPYL